MTDPEQLDRLATGLEQYCEEVEASMQRIEARFTDLGRSWRDNEYQRFARQLEEVLRILSRTIGQSREQIPELRDRARILREYPGG